jgi:hypothetical protein
MALLQYCVTTFIQASQHCSIFYQYFCLFSNSTTDGYKTENEIFSVCCSGLKSNARLLHHLIEISDLYQTGRFRMITCAAKQHVNSFTSVHKFRFGVWVTFWTNSISANTYVSVLPFCDAGVRHFPIYATLLLVFIKPEDGIEKISRNVASFQKSYYITLHLLVHVWMKTG